MVCQVLSIVERVLDSRTIHTVGTLSMASGAAVLVLSLSVVLVGIADIVVASATTTDAVSVLVRTVAAGGSAVGGTGGRLSLGVLGVGVGCWLLGVGLLLQGRTER